MLPEVAGRDVLVIDDIFDTGHTLVEVLSFLDDLGPRSIRTAVLVLKQGKQRGRRCGPIMSALKFRTCSSSATAWITTTPIAICRIWRLWSRRISKLSGES